MDILPGARARIEPFLDPMLWRQLRGALQFLQSHKYPYVPNPPSCTKRASVALIVRVRPATPTSEDFNPKVCGAAVGVSEKRLENFFAQQWVQQGEPEVLFIKRASRTGDRWTGHIAFPGGGRELNDQDDCATSVRETQEEIGLDLNADHCMLVGNLPEQVVTTWWSKKPLMVLCPYVHLLMRSDINSLSLQPSEVSSAHWVSLRALMSPHLRTFERSDVSERFFRRGSRATRMLLSAMVGQLLFTARTLVPTETIYSRSIADYIPSNQGVSQRQTDLKGKLQGWWYRPRSTVLIKGPPLILWGLTYGIMANFIGLFPTDNPTEVWDWPTLSPWDIRFIIWLTTYRFRAEKMKTLELSNSASRDPRETSSTDLRGLDTETFSAVDTNIDFRPRSKLSSVELIGEMLDGYFERLKTAIWIALILRLGLGTLLATMLVRRYRRNRDIAHL